MIGRTMTLWSNGIVHLPSALGMFLRQHPGGEGSAGVDRQAQIA